MKAGGDGGGGRGKSVMDSINEAIQARQEEHRAQQRTCADECLDWLSWFGHGRFAKITPCRGAT